MLVLAIFIALISLAVLLPIILNAGESVYKVTQLVGTCNSSWEDAAKNAVETR